MKPLITILTTIASAVTLLLIAGCNRNIAPHTVTTVKDSIQVKVVHDVVYQVKDTFVTVNQDSSLVDMLFECDSLRRLSIKSVANNKSGTHVFTPTLKVHGDTLTAGCKVDSFSVYVHWKERYERTDSSFIRNKDSVSIKTVTVRQNYISGWQNFQMWMGRILLIIIACYAGLRILKNYSGLTNILKWVI